ncbi:hypothetical protein BaRGS_00007501 [Batillaria attramentaria]|uniref:Uncharacterized protein n=1 Tax=Batillaria attramentaria TaxID=370345 RepID=A0ABD0LQD6_9CAEN
MSFPRAGHLQNVQDVSFVIARFVAPSINHQHIQRRETRAALRHRLEPAITAYFVLSALHTVLILGIQLLVVWLSGKLVNLRRKFLCEKSGVPVMLPAVPLLLMLQESHDPPCMICERVCPAPRSSKPVRCRWHYRPENVPIPQLHHNHHLQPFYHEEPPLTIPHQPA